MTTHLHHKLPRYRGGGDEPENLVSVSLTQHIMWHFANWTLWGDYRDKVAYKLLANTDASEEMEQARLQKSREAIANLPPEHFVERGKKISETKRRDSHITSEFMKVQRAGGIALTEEGRQKVLEGARRANDARKISVKNIKTGEQYPGIKPAARATHTSVNTIRQSIRTGHGDWIVVG